MTPFLNNCPAPAKLNLFLHVTGRRNDGYHLLETAFQFIDYGDVLHFSLRMDGIIERSTTLSGVPPEQDLVIRAARLLQSHSGCALGATIALEKKLPMGGGLGGGSSDAATALIALNRLWNTGISRSELMALGLQLGADVPFFLFGQNAFAQGVGEDLIALTTPDCWYVVVEPGVQVPTPLIFSAKELTRDSKQIKVSDFQCYPQGDWRNDLQTVAIELFPEILAVLGWLNEYGNARMTGSGSCVFCACDTEQAALEILSKLAQQPHNWRGWAAKSLNVHPLTHFLE